jgi:hypothetical protein
MSSRSIQIGSSIPSLYLVPWTDTGDCRWIVRTPLGALYLIQYGWANMTLGKADLRFVLKCTDARLVIGVKETTIECPSLPTEVDWHYYAPP